MEQPQYHHPDGPELARMALRAMVACARYSDDRYREDDTHDATSYEAFSWLISDLAALATHLDIAVNIACLEDGSHSVAIGKHVPAPSSFDVAAMLAEAARIMDGGQS